MGPTLSISEELHAIKYRGNGETFYAAMTRIADALKDDNASFRKFREILLDMRFMPAGRVQAAMGAARQVTPYNCFVSGTIADSMDIIMDRAKEAAQTLRMGGGIGYDFSNIRPNGDLIKSLDTRASGPVSFMGIYDALCKTVASAGHRRGAQMGVLRVNHPDIETFIRAKNNNNSLTQFNISVAVTDEFMHAVEYDTMFDLVFDDTVYKTVRARQLWNEIMRSTWEWAEPGVLFIDRINNLNNLWYCETIAATNPCAEQPLPPYGACLLGSLNLVRYIKTDANRYFDWNTYIDDIPHIIRAMDNIVDLAIYPLEEQQHEAQSKRRMGIGITGLANACEALGFLYGTPEFLAFEDKVLSVLKNEAYRTSALIAKKKGVFPLYNRKKYGLGTFIEGLDEDVRELIYKHGVRNSHLTSIAPTGTISLAADNISSGIEPVFAYTLDRTINMPDGKRKETVEDYGYRVFGIKGKVSTDCTANDHLNVLLTAYKHVDSAVSKTCNVSPNMLWDEFKMLYFRAWKGGAKGLTTFNPGGARFGMMEAIPQSEENQGAACYFDPESGKKSCE